MKYIDADLLRAEIKFAKSVYDDPKRVVYGVADAYRQDGRAAMCDDILKKIDSLQQDETRVDKMLCSQVWWEEQGWIMIPPDATLEGIDSLLRQVRKKLQQEQPSLPSDLDEAAKQFQGRWDNDQSPEASFKAGAQWRDAQIPKLPDSIDEAAEEYGYINWQSEDYHEGASEGLPFDAIGHTANCFKAGAEWMAAYIGHNKND